jgi:hypothetical protein
MSKAIIIFLIFTFLLFLPVYVLSQEDEEAIYAQLRQDMVMK